MTIQEHPQNKETSRFSYPKLLSAIGSSALGGLLYSVVFGDLDHSLASPAKATHLVYSMLLGFITTKVIQQMTDKN